MIEIEKAKTDPASVFKRPSDVVKEPSLSQSEKIDILRRWAYDEREMAVAEEENMRSTESSQANILDEILKCLIELGQDTDSPLPPPTKQG